MKDINDIIKKLLVLSIENDLTHINSHVFGNNGDYDISVEININKSFKPLSVMDTLENLNPPLKTQEGIKE